MACYSRWDPGNCGCTCTLQVQVLGCNGGACKAGLTVEIRSGGSTLETQTTDGSGVATFTTLVAGSYDVRVSDTRTPSRWQTKTDSGVSFTCGGTVNVSMTTPQTSFVCTPWCEEPISKTLSATDPTGTFTLTWRFGYVWSGCASGSKSSVVTAVAVGTCAATVGTGTVSYVIQLQDAAGFPSLSDTWAYYNRSGQERTTATATCSAGIMNVHSGLIGICDGIVVLTAAIGTGTSLACPLSFSVSGTMPSTGAFSTANPGAGTLTVTE